MTETLLQKPYSELQNCSEFYEQVEKEREEKKNKPFWFHGRWFSSPKEGLDHFMEWYDSATTFEEFSIELDGLKSFLWHHMQKNNLILSNKQTGDLCTKMLHFFLKNMPKEKIANKSEEKKVRSKRVEKSIKIFQQTINNR